MNRWFFIIERDFNGKISEIIMMPFSEMPCILYVFWGNFHSCPGGPRSQCLCTLDTAARPGINMSQNFVYVSVESISNIFPNPFTRVMQSLEPNENFKFSLNRAIGARGGLHLCPKKGCIMVIVSVIVYRWLLPDLNFFVLNTGYGSDINNGELTYEDEKL